MAVLIENLQAEIRRYLIAAMPPDPTGRLADMDLGGLLTTYGGWRNRFVPAQPRTVHVSRELLASDLSSVYGGPLAAIRSKLVAGEDITSHLSTRIRHAFEPGNEPTTIHRRADRDLLLSDWGIHHLHLSTDPHPEAPGFNARTKHVLFVAFRGANAYLIGIYPHPKDNGNWAERAIVETVVRNWPQAGIVHCADYAVGLAEPEPSDEDRLKLRNAGVNTPFEIDGSVYLPLGQMLDGTSIVVARHVMEVRAVLDHYRSNEDELEYRLASCEASHNLTGDSAWRAVVEREQYGFTKANVLYCLGNLVG